MNFKFDKVVKRSKKTSVVKYQNCVAPVESNLKNLNLMDQNMYVTYVYFIKTNKHSFNMSYH